MDGPFARRYPQSGQGRLVVVPDSVLKAINRWQDIEVEAAHGRCGSCKCSYGGDYVGRECGDLSTALKSGLSVEAAMLAQCHGLVVARAEDYVPVFTCLRLKGDRYTFFCSPCNLWHEHSAEDGYRHAHCFSHRPNGYSLRCSAGTKAGVKARNADEHLLAKWFQDQAWTFGHLRMKVSDVVGLHENESGPRQKTERRSMRLKTEFFKDGDRLAIRTNATTEDEFIDSASSVLSNIIESGRFANDWDFQLGFWLRSIVDITCKLRGYKSDVQEERVITSGSMAPSEHHRVGVFGDSVAPEVGVSSE